MELIQNYLVIFIVWKLFLRFNGSTCDKNKIQAYFLWLILHWVGIKTELCISKNSDVTDSWHFLKLWHFKLNLKYLQYWCIILYNSVLWELNFIHNDFSFYYILVTKSLLCNIHKSENEVYWKLERDTPYVLIHHKNGRYPK